MLAVRNKFYTSLFPWYLSSPAQQLNSQEELVSKLSRTARNRRVFWKLQVVLGGQGFSCLIRTSFNLDVMCQIWLRTSGTPLGDYTLSTPSPYELQDVCMENNLVSSLKKAIGDSICTPNSTASLLQVLVIPAWRWWALNIQVIHQSQMAPGLFSSIQLSVQKYRYVFPSIVTS